MPCVGERLADGCRPQPVDDRELVGEAVEPLRRSTGSRTPYAVCSASYQPAPRPSSTRPPLIWSTCATLIASSPGLRNVTGETSVPSRIVDVSRASPASVIHASVGPGQARPVAHHEVVVAAEEGAEAERLGPLGHREQRVVRGALLGFGEDAEVGELHGGAR